MAVDTNTVYFLFDDDDRRTVASLIRREKGRVGREIERAKRDLELVKDAAAAMDIILTLLARMRLIAVESKRPRADRAALSMEFEGLKTLIDGEADRITGWPKEDSDRIRRMVEELDTSELDIGCGNMS